MCLCTRFSTLVCARVSVHVHMLRAMRVHMCVFMYTCFHLCIYTCVCDYVLMDPLLRMYVRNVFKPIRFFHLGVCESHDMKAFAAVPP